jgi:hypothetical protein
VFEGQRKRYPQELTSIEAAGHISESMVQEVIMDAVKGAVLTIGKKHKGKPLRQIAQEDPRYLQWLAGEPWISGKLRAALSEVPKSASRPMRPNRRPW